MKEVHQQETPRVPVEGIPAQEENNYIDPNGYWIDRERNVRRMGMKGGGQVAILRATPNCSDAEWKRIYEALGCVPRYLESVRCAVTNWRQLYTAAMLEADFEILGVLVDDASRAIEIRLEELVKSRDGEGERQEIAVAGKALIALKADRKALSKGAAGLWWAMSEGRVSQCCLVRDYKVGIHLRQRNIGPA